MGYLIVHLASGDTEEWAFSEAVQVDYEVNGEALRVFQNDRRDGDGYNIYADNWEEVAYYTPGTWHRVSKRAD